jgi:hypothetical protein
MADKFRRIPCNFQGSLTCRKSATWDRWLYFPSEGRRAVDFFARKLGQLRLGLNLQSWVPESRMLTTRPPKPLCQGCRSLSHKECCPGCTTRRWMYFAPGIGHDCLGTHLYCIGMCTDPYCVLCNLCKPMDRNHLGQCTALSNRTECEQYWGPGQK